MLPLHRHGPIHVRLYFPTRTNGMKWLYSMLKVSKAKQRMDQPGRVANPARGQLNGENEYFPLPVRA